MRTYPATTIAYAFVKRGIETGNPVTQMKLQKLVYFAQGLHLASYKHSLIEDEVEAWKFGPVIPSVYRAYKLYGSRPITDFKWVSNVERDEKKFNTLDAAALDTINQTWEALRDWSAIELSNWTHLQDSPWTKYYKEGVEHIEIPRKQMQRYFERYIIE